MGVDYYKIGQLRNMDFCCRSRMKLHVLSSSHGLMIKEYQSQMGLSPLDKVSAFSGVFICDKQFPKDPDSLIPLEEVTKEKLAQQNLLRETIQESSYITALNILGSNDLKFFIVDGLGRLLPCVEGALVRWEGLSWNSKVYYQPRHCRLFPKETALFVEARVGDFMKILVGMYKQSRFERVYVSSILERIYKTGRLVGVDIYMALINYYICRYINRMYQNEPVFNKLKKPIKFTFINVSSQFYKSKDKDKLFSAKDRAKRRLVHRTKEAWIELMQLYLKQLKNT